MSAVIKQFKTFLKKKSDHAILLLSTALGIKPKLIIMVLKVLNCLPSAYLLCLIIYYYFSFHLIVVT